MITIKKVDTSNSDLINLIALLDADLNSRYGLLQVQYNVFNSLTDLDYSIVAYHGEKPIGCGSYKIYNENTVEIKRVFVLPENRGTGAAKMIMDELESHARNLNFKKTILETGIKQVEAIRFYIKLGYENINNYDQYIGNSNSICMAKNL